MPTVSELLSQNITNTITNSQTWNGILYNVKAYGAKGDGTTDDTAKIADAITAASTSGGIVYFPPGTYLVGSALTFPSNATVEFSNGAKLSVNTGITVTINGPIDAGLYQIFSGVGSVSMGSSLIPQVYPQWWGAKADGTTDDRNAVNSAVNAGKGIVFFAEGTYKISSALTVPSTVTIAFENGAILSPDTGITVTINGPINAAIHQIFSGAGTIAGTPKVDAFYPQWWGAKGDGVTDDKTAIQATIATAQTAGGGIVFLSPGTYIIGSTLTITASNIRLMGAGTGSIIKCNFATENVIYAGRVLLTDQVVQNISFKDFAITSSVAKTSGAAIFCEHAERYVIEGVKAAPAESNFNLYDGFYFRYFDNCLVSNAVVNCSHYGITMQGKSDQSWGANLFINDGSKISTNNITNSYGVYIGGGCGGVSIEETDIINCMYGIWMDNVLATINNREIFLNQCFIDSSGNHGIQVNDNGVTLLHLNNTWIASSGSVSNGGFPNGNNINTSSVLPAGSNFLLDGCRIYNAYGSGIVANAGEWTITSSSIHNNGKGTAGGHGIDIENANVTNLLIEGNSILSNGNATLGIGVRIVAGVTNFLVANNIIRLNGTSQINSESVGKTANNIGYNPVGNIAAPAIPASGTAYTNSQIVTTRVHISGGTVTEIAINGTTTGLISGTFILEPNDAITLTYSAAPTWTWFGL